MAKWEGTDLPKDGDYPYFPPKNWNTPKKIKRSRKYEDVHENEWEKARPEVAHGGEHWDVTHLDGTHTNVTFDGRVIGGSSRSRFPNRRASDFRRNKMDSTEEGGK